MAVDLMDCSASNTKQIANRMMRLDRMTCLNSCGSFAVQSCKTKITTTSAEIRCNAVMEIYQWSEC